MSIVPRSEVVLGHGKDNLSVISFVNGRELKNTKCYAISPSSIAELRSHLVVHEPITTATSAPAFQSTTPLVVR